jgi:hypothetical protein
MTHKIIRAHSNSGSPLAALEPKIQAALDEGWQLNGTPFEDKSTLEWCQSVTKTSGGVLGMQPGEVQLREPAGPASTILRDVKVTIPIPEGATVPMKPPVPAGDQIRERLKKK